MGRTIRVRSLVNFTLGMVLALAASFVLARSWSASAAPDSDDAATFVPVEPCRLFDYRPTPFTVGNRNVPLGPGEAHVQQVTGEVGNCGVPPDATAVAMNVTITEPTAASFLTVFPADAATVPTVSSLNWVAGQAATPNKVDVRLSPAGRIKLYNRFGQVFVLGDVVGYYTSTALDEIRSVLAERYHPIFYGFSEPGTTWTVGTDWSTIDSISTAATVEGEDFTGAEIGSASFTVVATGDAETVQCGFGRTPASYDWLPPAHWEAGDFSGSGWAEWQSPIGGGRSQLTIINTESWGLVGGTHVWKLFCRSRDGGFATIKNLHLSVRTGEFGWDESLG